MSNTRDELTKKSSTSIESPLQQTNETFHEDSGVFRTPLVLEPVLHTVEHEIKHTHTHHQITANAIAKSIHGIELGLTAYEIFHHTEDAPASPFERGVLATGAAALSTSYATTVLANQYLNNLAPHPNHFLKAGQFLLKTSILGYAALPICEMPLNYYQVRKDSQPWVASVASLAGATAGTLYGVGGAVLLDAGLVPEPLSPVLITSGLAMIYASAGFAKTITRGTACILNKAVEIDNNFLINLAQSLDDELERKLRKLSGRYARQVMIKDKTKGHYSCDYASNLALNRAISRESQYSASRIPHRVIAALKENISKSAPSPQFTQPQQKLNSPGLNAGLHKSKSQQPKAFDKGLESGLKKLFETNPAHPTTEPKKPMSKIQPIINAAKEFSANIKSISSESKDNSATKNERLIAAYKTFSDATRSAAQIAGGIAGMSGLRGLERKVISGAGSVLEIGNTILAIKTAGVNPALGMLSIAGELFKFGSVLSGDDEGEGSEISEALQQLFSAIQSMWNEFRQEFRLLHAEIAELSAKIDYRFERVEHLLRNYKEAIIEHVKGVNQNLSEAKSVILSGIQQISLQPAFTILSEAMKCDVDGEIKPNASAIQMLHWIRGKNCASAQGLLTGANELTEEKFILNKIDIIKNMNHLDSYIGFLVLMAKQICPDEFKSVNVNAIVNPTVWIQMTDAYIGIRKGFMRHIKDEKCQDIDDIIQVGKEFLKTLDLIRNNPKFFVEIFKYYEDILQQIEKIELAIIQNENSKINDEMFKQNQNEAKIDMDLKHEFKNNVQRFRGRIPVNISFAVHMQGNGGAFKSSTVNPIELAVQLDPEFLLLHYLGQSILSWIGNIVHTGVYAVLSSKLDEKNDPSRLLTINYEVAKKILNEQLYFATYTNYPHECAPVVWDARTNPKLALEPEYKNHLAKARQNATSYFQRLRNNIKFENDKLASAYQQLDTCLKLMRTFARLTGLNEEQINKLDDSKSLRDKMQSSVAKLDAKVYMAHADSVPHVNQVKEGILKQVKDVSHSTHFRSRYYYDVELRICELEALKVQARRVAEESQQKKHNEQKQTSGKSSDEQKSVPPSSPPVQQLPTAVLKELSDAINLFLRPYKNLFKSWQVCFELMKVDEDLRSFEVFKPCQENQAMVKELFEQIDSLKDQQLLDVVTVLNQLHQRFLDLHNNLAGLFFGKYNFTLPFGQQFSATEIKIIIQRYQAAIKTHARPAMPNMTADMKYTQSSTNFFKPVDGQQAAHRGPDAKSTQPDSQKKPEPPKVTVEDLPNDPDKNKP